MTLGPHVISGGCHCGNIRLDLTLANAPQSYQPRACDCDFCRKHAAAYMSDARGSLLIRIRDLHGRGSYRQGSGSAEFSLCKVCGVLIAVQYASEGRLFAAVNAKVIDASLGAEQAASHQQLSVADRVKRWQALWFPDVTLCVDGA